MQIDFSKKLFKKVPLFLQCILLFDAMSFSLLIFIKMKKKRNRKLKIQISLKKDSALTKIDRKYQSKDRLLLGGHFSLQV